MELNRVSRLLSLSLIAVILLFVTGIVFVAAAAPNSEAVEREINQSLAVAYVQTEEFTLILQSRVFPCAGGAKRAVVILMQAPVVYVGCWVEHEGVIQLTDEDGDYFTFPVRAFHWNGRST